MSEGKLAFSQEEIEAAFPTPKQYFADGVPREVVVVSKTLVPKVSQAGNPYTQVEWLIADAKTQEPHEMKFGFDFSNALKPFKNTMRLETSVYRVTATKTGEDAKGYEKFAYSAEYVGEQEASPKASVEVKSAGF